MGRVEGKVALITGAARGMGRSQAQRLAAEGADIIAVDVCEQVSPMYKGATEEDLAETVKLVEDLGRRIVAAKVDVRDFAALKGAVDTGVSELGRLDIVVANAGVLTMGCAWELSEEEWDQVIDVNLKGAWQTLKAATPQMIAGADGGSMILITSEAGMKGRANMAHYSSSKFGVEGLAQVFAKELAPYSIRVNTVCPSAVATEMTQNEGLFKLFRPDLENPTAEDCEGPLRDLNLLPNTWTDPAEIANAVLFLASDEATYVTGLSLRVDSGSVVK
ncbi:mycofactocin-coupled SDR family oxidoreductase [Mycobacterium sp. UM_WWY]